MASDLVDRLNYVYPDDIDDRGDILVDGEVYDPTTGNLGFKDVFYILTPPGLDPPAQVPELSALWILGLGRAAMGAREIEKGGRTSR